MVFSSLSTTYKLHVYSGAGNRFLLSDSLPSSNEILTLCHHYQVDGFLVVLPSCIATAKLIIFNNDGSRPSMCGNGLRCSIAHIASLTNTKEISVETDAGVYHGTFTSWDQINVDMTLPQWHYREHNLSEVLEGMPSKVFYIDTGVPHLIMFVKDLSCVNVQLWGEFLRYHTDFAPEGVNVDFVELVGSQSLKIRTYERGLERESQACGTGITAAALVAAKQYNWENTRVSVYTWHDVLMKVFLCNHRVYLEGPVNKENDVFL